jgi:hypothetical protein
MCCHKMRPSFLQPAVNPVRLPEKKPSTITEIKHDYKIILQENCLDG